MSTNGEERSDLVILIDEEGNEHEFELIDRFQVDQNEYAVLVPALYLDEEDEEDPDQIDYEDEAFIFRIDLEEGEETLVEVEDEAEWNSAAAVWEERMQTLEYEDDEELF